MIQYKIAQDLEHGEDWKFLRIWFSRGRQGLETHPTNDSPGGLLQVVMGPTVSNKVKNTSRVMMV